MFKLDLEKAEEAEIKLPTSTGSLKKQESSSKTSTSALFGEGNVRECSNYCTNALISHANKVMLKILKVRHQEYMNRELPDVQAGFIKGRGTRDQAANIHWIIEKPRELQKSIYFCFIDYVKAFECVDHNKLWKILQEMGIPDHLTCLLRYLYAGQEATVRTSWNNRLVPNQERSTSRLYIVTLLI